MDWDHTKGLSELFRYVSPNTAFILPTGISVREILSSIISSKDYYSKEYRKVFQLIDSNIISYNLVHADMHSQIYSFSLFSKDKVYNLQMNTFAPVGKIVKEKTIDTIEKIVDKDLSKTTKGVNQYKSFNKENNLFSVGLHLVIVGESSNISVCLCGDLENITIKEMHPQNRKRIFGENTVFKIPHHCSKSASELFDSQCLHRFMYGVTTSFKSANLPDKEMLEMYKQCGTVSRTDLHGTEYGVVRYSIPIVQAYNNKPTTKYWGAAGQA